MFLIVVALLFMPALVPFSQELNRVLPDLGALVYVAFFASLVLIYLWIRRRIRRVPSVVATREALFLDPQTDDPIWWDEVAGFSLVNGGRHRPTIVEIALNSRGASRRPPDASTGDPVWSISVSASRFDVGAAKVVAQLKSLWLERIQDGDGDVSKTAVPSAPKPEFKLTAADARYIYSKNRWLIWLQSAVLLAVSAIVLVFVLEIPLPFQPYNYDVRRTLALVALIPIYRMPALWKIDTPAIVVLDQGLVLMPETRPYTILPWRAVRAIDKVERPGFPSLLGVARIEIELSPSFDHSSLGLPRALLRRDKGASPNTIVLPANHFDRPLAEVATKLSKIWSGAQ
ncbi:MAG: hypothetical protein AAFV19_18305 [Pseudomonadota bacterium]